MRRIGMLLDHCISTAVNCMPNIGLLLPAGKRLMRICAKSRMVAGSRPVLIGTARSRPLRMTKNSELKIVAG